MSRRLIAIFAVFSFIAVLVMAPGCSGPADPWPVKPGPRVVTSFAPLYCFALNVAGEDASVLCVMSDTGPHHFDPSPENAVSLRRADLFLINGLDLDDQIATKMARSSRNKNLSVVRLAEAIPKNERIEGQCNCGHAHGEAEKDDPDHEHFDPHVWLGIPQAIRMVEKIRDVLKEKDPEHAKGYEERAGKYTERLKKMEADCAAMLKDKKDKKVLSFHDSLKYFAKDFGLDIVDYIEVAPGSEPDAKKLKELISTAKEKNVHVIAVEPQYDANTSAKLILRELKNAKVEVAFAEVDPIETAKANELNADYYERKMRENVRNLADKLK